MVAGGDVAGGGSQQTPPVRSSDVTIKQVAAFGLQDRSEPVADAPLSDADWSRLLGQVRYQRLAGFLNAAVEAEALPVTDEQRDEVQELHLQACSTALWLESRLLEIVDLLERNGIEVVVLKGTAVAHLAYPDPALRSYGDNDVLLPSDRYDKAVELLTRNGYTRQTVQARSGFERRFGKGVTLDGDGGDELDLHRNLVFGSFGFRIDLDELFRSAESFDLGGRRLYGLGPETRLLHACYHAALGDPVPRYGSVRDIAQMLMTGDHDPERVIELVGDWGSSAVVSRGISLCRDLLGIDPGDPVARAFADHLPSPRERRALESYVGENRSFAAKALASLPYIDGLGAKLSFLRAVVIPQRGFPESFGGRPGVAWVRRGARSLVGKRRR